MVTLYLVEGVLRIRMRWSYWFNPYLPFGGSSCTSIAQRQSDTIRTVAKIAGVKALTVVMPDDFLLVCPHQHKDSDQDTLDRGHARVTSLTKFYENLDHARQFRKISQPRLQLTGVESNISAKRQFSEFLRTNGKRSQSSFENQS